MMESGKYLYGASVQGIQDFIFQTNKLKEIAGASELVEQICTVTFGEILGKPNPSDPQLVENDPNWIMGAAGKIIYVFENREDCRNAVRWFSRKVMTMAPGITISQAVVAMTGEYAGYGKASDELEKRLRIQRNRAVRPMTLGLMAIRRAPTTGFSAVKYIEKDGWIDEASFQKRDFAQTKKLTEKIAGVERLADEQIAYDFEEIIEKGKNNWIAVIHADGNGLGRIVEAVCKNRNDAKTFSVLLDKITKQSAQEAYSSLEHLFNNSKVIPIRPVVLGGDDLTVICRGDLAVEFTRIFLETFEKKSKELLRVLDKYEVVRNGLTACAGIAFIKSSYPFHYAVNLAERLCRETKKKAKDINRDLAPSCMMFHKVQDSFVEDFNKVIERELKPQSNLSFECGPYYFGEHAKSFGEKCENTVDSLLTNIAQFEGKEGNAIKSHIRQWLSLLFENVDAANQKMKRLRTVNKKAYGIINREYEDLKSPENKENIEPVPIPYYDMLSLASIMYVETKTKEEKK
jgi:hypothetical protein